MIESGGSFNLSAHIFCRHSLCSAIGCSLDISSCSPWFRISCRHSPCWCGSLRWDTSSNFQYWCTFCKSIPWRHRGRNWGISSCFECFRICNCSPWRCWSHSCSISSSFRCFRICSCNPLDCTTSRRDWSLLRSASCCCQSGCRSGRWCKPSCFLCFCRHRSNPCWLVFCNFGTANSSYLIFIDGEI